MNERPPRVDVAADYVARFVVCREVMRQLPAASGAGHAQGRDADAVEHPRARGIDVRLERGLDASLQDQHLARVTRRRPLAALPRSRDVIAELARQQALHEPAHRERASEQRAGHERLAQDVALRGFRRRSPDLRFDQPAPDVDQPAVLHARRARGLAIAARQATIEVELRLGRDGLALEHLLDEVDASARPVELVAQELVRRARRRAKAAMHARAQDCVGFAAVVRVAVLGGEIRLH
jgi:hypothetical protein